MGLSPIYRISLAYNFLLLVTHGLVSRLTCTHMPLLNQTKADPGDHQDATYLTHTHTQTVTQWRTTKVWADGGALPDGSSSVPLLCTERHIHTPLPSHTDASRNLRLFSGRTNPQADTHTWSVKHMQLSQTQKTSLFTHISYKFEVDFYNQILVFLGHLKLKCLTWQFLIQYPQYVYFSVIKCREASQWKAVWMLRSSRVLMCVCVGWLQTKHEMLQIFTDEELFQCENLGIAENSWNVKYSRSDTLAKMHKWQICENQFDK